MLTKKIVNCVFLQMALTNIMCICSSDIRLNRKHSTRMRNYSTILRQYFALFFNGLPRWNEFYQMQSNTNSHPEWTIIIIIRNLKHKQSLWTKANSESEHWKLVRLKINKRFEQCRNEFMSFLCINISP